MYSLFLLGAVEIAVGFQFKSKTPSWGKWLRREKRGFR